jgi:peptide/nickel transport system permease protein
MLLVIALLSVVSFIIIQLPPGDYLTVRMEMMRASGTEMAESEIASLRSQYGLDLPVYFQYLKWVGGFLRGNFGMSFQWNQPVRDLIGGRLLLTILMSTATLLFTYAVAIPIGVYSATHQYSAGDYAFSTLGFIGLATPNFLLALILMFVFFKAFGLSVGGLFSPEYLNAPWSWGRFVDMMKHMPIPIVVIGLAGTAGLIRVMRGTLLDELKKQYVVTARAKGVAENTLLFKYPVRVAINPIVSTVGWVLPAIVSGATIVSMVLSLPTTGPLLFKALLAQDMYLSATILMLLSSLTVIGTFVSDVLLAMLDPRIRLE